MVKCPKCDFDLKFCNNCGQLLPPFEKMPKDSKNNFLCPFCKEIIIYCPHCGYNFSEIKTQKEILLPNIEKIDPKIIESLIKKIKEKSIEKRNLEIKNEGKTINFQENLFCAFHPLKKANKECDICSKPICEECIKKYGDLILCHDDYYSIIREVSSFSIESERKN